MNNLCNGNVNNMRYLAKVYERLCGSSHVPNKA